MCWKQKDILGVEGCVGSRRIQKDVLEVEGYIGCRRIWERQGCVGSRRILRRQGCVRCRCTICPSWVQKDIKTLGMCQVQKDVSGLQGCIRTNWAQKGKLHNPKTNQSKLDVQAQIGTNQFLRANQNLVDKLGRSSTTQMLKYRLDT